MAHSLAHAHCSLARHSPNLDLVKASPTQFCSIFCRDFKFSLLLLLSLCESPLACCTLLDKSKAAKTPANSLPFPRKMQQYHRQPFTSRVAQGCAKCAHFRSTQADNINRMAASGSLMMTATRQLRRYTHTHTYSHRQ